VLGADPIADRGGNAAPVLGVLPVPGIDQAVDLIQVDDLVLVGFARDEEVVELMVAVGVVEDLQQVTENDFALRLFGDRSDRGGLAGSAGSEDEQYGVERTEARQPGIHAGQINRAVEITRPQVSKLHSKLSFYLGSRGVGAGRPRSSRSHGGHDRQRRGASRRMVSQSPLDGKAPG